MELSKAEVKGHNIVLLGDFNPKIFQPAWFAAENLIQKAEADKADIRIVHPDLVGFSLDWLLLDVTRERFIAGTIQEPYDVIIRDLVIGAFRLLHHTPIKKMAPQQNVC